MSHTSPAFASVAAAFDFEHHDGTDPALELNVLKSVLIREGLLGKVRRSSLEISQLCASLRAIAT